MPVIIRRSSFAPGCVGAVTARASRVAEGDVGQRRLTCNQTYIGIYHNVKYKVAQLWKELCSGFLCGIESETK
jgi:hypothetical protein